MMKVHECQNNTPEQQNAQARKTNYAALAVVAACLLMPQFAFAAGNAIQNMLDGVIGFFNSGVVRSIAILAIIAMGVAAYIGKISWDLVMKIGGGIVLTVGASALADQFMGYVG